MLRISKTLLGNSIVIVVLANSFLACKPRREAESAVKVASTNFRQPAVDVNDLSYMLPRNSTGQIYPLIEVSKSWQTLINRAYRREMQGNAQGFPIMKDHVFNNVVLATEFQDNF